MEPEVSLASSQEPATEITPIQKIRFSDLFAQMFLSLLLIDFIIVLIFLISLLFSDFIAIRLNRPLSVNLTV
jgi:hypothetical protein